MDIHNINNNSVYFILPIKRISFFYYAEVINEDPFRFY